MNGGESNYISLKALGVSLVGVLVTLLIKGKGTEIERKGLVEEGTIEV